ncbi:hypothetical protein J4232_00225 [Candidatus Woesearchaeota archaeon]|nr:hypothetical protein [Candidatus Woesearchaeota archaeon]
MNQYFEIKRKLLHILLGIILIVLLYYDILTAIILIITIVIGLIAAYSAKHCTLPIISWCLDKFERRNVFPGKGVFTFLIGTTIVIAVFQKEIALAAIAILTFGDSFSHLIGRYYGNIKHPLNNEKLIEGTIAGIVIGFASALFFVSPIEAFSAALFAISFESFEIRIKQYIIDDNISIPVIAGVVIFVLRLL